MGLGFVLIFWAVIGLILSGIGALFLGGATWFFTRRVVKGRLLVIVAASLFPFACFAWGGVVFVFQAIVSELFLHRDAGLGDAWRCTLPNGYEILMIDVTDQGWVYNPKTGTSGAVSEREDSVAGVRLLQISGPYLLGAVDRNAFEHLGKESNAVDSYFILDTRSGERKTLQDYDALSDAAVQLGIQLNLEPIETVYFTYRSSWFDVFVGVLFFAPPVGGFLLLVRWVAKLRRKQAPATKRLPPQ